MAALSAWQLPVFRDLVLEESSVFEIRESPTEICFEMEFVLNERHPSHRTPPADQAHCYRRGRLTFQHVADVTWVNKRPRAADASEDADLGKVDMFIVDGGVYKLRGPWGRLELRAQSIKVDVW